MTINMRPRASRLVSTVLTVVLAGCSSGLSPIGSCTAMGCAGGFAIDFNKTSSWEAGDYTVSTKLDGEETSCVITLPFSSCGDTPVCVGDTINVIIGRSGCALNAQQHKLSGVQITTKTPKVIVISVTLAGAVLAERTLKPTYTESRPNGPECTPVCKQAPTATVQLK